MLQKLAASGCNGVLKQKSKVRSPVSRVVAIPLLGAASAIFAIAHTDAKSKFKQKVLPVPPGTSTKAKKWRQPAESLTKKLHLS